MAAKKSATPSRNRNRPAMASRYQPLIAFNGELPLEDRREKGRELRSKLPREKHSKWSRRSDFPGAVQIVMASNKGRVAEYVPLRLVRMAASPFAFYRGAATVMACDLAATPATGIKAVIDGDAHIDNFGLYGTPQRDVIFDLSDFDEAVIGPWEWDLKRLTASINVAARENGLNPYFVRQMKNMKGSIPVEWLSGKAFSFYVWGCGAILARAHAHSRYHAYRRIQWKLLRARRSSCRLGRSLWRPDRSRSCRARPGSQKATALWRR